MRQLVLSANVAESNTADRITAQALPGLNTKTYTEIAELTSTRSCWRYAMSYAVGVAAFRLIPELADALTTFDEHAKMRLYKNVLIVDLNEVEAKALAAEVRYLAALTKQGNDVSVRRLTLARKAARLEAA